MRSFSTLDSVNLFFSNYFSFVILTSSFSTSFLNKCIGCTTIRAINLSLGLNICDLNIKIILFRIISIVCIPSLYFYKDTHSNYDDELQCSFLSVKLDALAGCKATRASLMNVPFAPRCEGKDGTPAE